MQLVNAVRECGSPPDGAAVREIVGLSGTVLDVPRRGLEPWKYRKPNSNNGRQSRNHVQATSNVSTVFRGMALSSHPDSGCRLSNPLPSSVPSMDLAFRAHRSVKPVRPETMLRQKNDYGKL
jgi:hypothetical protein